MKGHGVKHGGLKGSGVGAKKSAPKPFPEKPLKMVAKKPTKMA